LIGRVLSKDASDPIVDARFDAVQVVDNALDQPPNTGFFAPRIG
jgi:hypothetical protein